MSIPCSPQEDLKQERYPNMVKGVAYIMQDYPLKC
jgi:hypothetical protein